MIAASQHIDPGPSWLWVLYIIAVIALWVWTRWYTDRPSKDPIVDPDHADLLGALERLSWPADVDRHLEEEPRPAVRGRR